MIKQDSHITQKHFEEALKVAYSYLDQLDNSAVIYHRKAHTVDCVVPAALEIAQAGGFSLEEILIVGIAAAFHDTGFSKQYNANEPIGAQFAENYMRSSQHSYTEERIQFVTDAIGNTDMKNPPKTRYAQI